MICPCPICRTTLGPLAPAAGGSCLFAAAACATVIVVLGSFAACATWFATVACALFPVVLCDSAVGAVLVLGCDAVAEVCGADWRPLSVASASFTFTETLCPPMFPLITLPEGWFAVVLLEPEPEFALAVMVGFVASAEKSASLICGSK